MKALIVVDVQNDFCEGGSLAVEGGTDVAQRIYQHMRKNGTDYAVMVATLDYHHRNGDNGGHFGTDEHPVDYLDRWPAHCVAGTPGAGFKAPLQGQMFAEIFTKGDGEPAYSGFQGTGQTTGESLQGFLKAYEIDEVDVVGLAYDYCVKATALDAAALGLSTTVLADLTASVSTETSTSATVALDEAGVAITPSTIA